MAMTLRKINQQLKYNEVLIESPSPSAQNIFESKNRNLFENLVKSSLVIFCGMNGSMILKSSIKDEN